MAGASGVNALVLVPVMFTVVGTVFVVVGIRTLRFARHFQAVAMRAEAVVTDMRHKPSRTAEAGSPGLWFPVLRFTTANGRQVDTEAMYGRSPAPARTGDWVTVLYDPADPTQAALEGKAGGGLLGAAFVGLGLLFAAFGLLFAGIWVFVRYAS